MRGGWEGVAEAQVTRQYGKNRLYEPTCERPAVRLEWSADVARKRAPAVWIGSLAELETQLEIALRLDLLRPEDVRPLIAERDQLGRVLCGWRKFLDNKRTAKFRYARPLPDPNSGP